MSVQERSETKNGAKMEPTWHQNGSQNGSNIDPQIWLNFRSIVDPFEEAFWSDLGSLFASFYRLESLLDTHL